MDSKDKKKKRRIRLRRCPFCGGKARMAHWDKMHEYSAYCMDCGAVAGDYEYTEEEAAHKWNRRFKLK